MLWIDPYNSALVTNAMEDPMGFQTLLMPIFTVSSQEAKEIHQLLLHMNIVVIWFIFFTASLNKETETESQTFGLLL